jgi:hypothetical protein
MVGVTNRTFVIRLHDGTANAGANFTDNFRQKSLIYPCRSTTKSDPVTGENNAREIDVSCSKFSPFSGPVPGWMQKFASSSANSECDPGRDCAERCTGDFANDSYCS